MLRLTPLPKLARNSETGGAQGDIIDTIFFTESEHHCSNSLFCCSTMYSGNGSFYRIRIVQSFVKTISEQSLVRGGVARLPQGEIFLRKNQTHNPEFIFVEHDWSLQNLWKFCQYNDLTTYTFIYPWNASLGEAQITAGFLIFIKNEEGN